MEVSGRRPQKQSSATGEGSSDEPQICAGCLEETDVAVEADGFCVTCNEFLCAPCYSIHRSPRPMKSHKLIDKHHMPDRPFSPEERCPKHNENLLDHFCCSHNQLACSRCVRIDHKRCEDVDYIPDICDHVKTTAELDKTRNELAKLEKETETISTEIDSNVNTVEELKASVISDIKNVQNELIHYIVKRVEILEKEIQQLNTQEKVKLQQIADQNVSLKKEIKKVTDELDMNEKYDRKLNMFTSMKNATSRISILMDRLHQIKDSNTYIQYGFVRDPNLQAILDQPCTCMGQISSDNGNTASAADLNLGETQHLMTNVETSKVAPADIKTPKRTAKVTQEMLHDPFSSAVKQASCGKQREVIGDGSNTAGVAATASHGSLHDVGTGTDKDKHTDKETLRQEAKVPERGVEQDQSAVKPGKSERNETNEAANQISVTYQAEVARKLIFERNLIAGLPSETYHCYITGMTLLPGNRLILVDILNKGIKLLDTNTDKIISHISVEGYPWDVTVVSRDRLAVTLVGGDPGKIQFVSVSGDVLSADGQLRVSPGCRGIACHGTNLYVSYIEFSGNPAQLQVLDLHGGVLQTFIGDTAGQPLFDRPRYITVGSDGNMYISDRNKHTLTCLDPRGQVQWRYQNRELRYPEGVAVDRYGSVYVAGFWSHNIHVVSSTGNQLQVLKGDGIRFPHILAFSEDGDRLYVGMRMDNSILVYKVLKLTETNK